MKHIPLLKLDHLGIRVTDLNSALEFYSLFGFKIDPKENLQAYQACALLHDCGFRINLMHNADNQQGHNVLLDAETKYPGIIHFAMVVDDMQDLQKSLAQCGIAVTEGPTKVSNRRIVCFVRDPDGNVIEFNQLI